MIRLLRSFGSRLRADERGLTTVEYMILLCLVAALAVGSWKTFGKNVHDYLDNATNTIDGNVKAASNGQVSK